MEEDIKVEHKIKENSPKIVFMGTPEFAKQSLKKLIESEFDVKAVVTNPDTKSGRGMKIRKTPVKEYIETIESNIEILQPEKIRNEEFYNKIKEYNPDYIIVVAYGKILPKQILEIAKKGCINVHGSILPKYRGAAPIQWAVLNGEKETGVTTMYMSEGMDEGDILQISKMKIEEEDTTETMFTKLAELGAITLVDTIEKLEKNEITPQKQDNNEATYAPMIEKDMANIDWNKDIEEIFNLVRGLNSFLGAKTELNEKQYKIWKTRIIEDIKDLEEIEQKTFEEKEVLLNNSEKLNIYLTKNRMFLNNKKIHGNKCLEILEIQPQSKNKMDVKTFLLGNTI